MALKTLKLARRSVNLADCTKSEVDCVDVTDCGGPPIEPVCPPVFPIPRRLRATVSSDCACLNGTYDLFYCGGAWRTVNPLNGFATDCSDGGWVGPAPVACGTDFWIIFECVPVGSSGFWSVRIELGATEQIGVLHCINRFPGLAPAVTGPPLFATGTSTWTHTPAGCPPGFTCTDPITITITITE